MVCVDRASEPLGGGVNTVAVVQTHTHSGKKRWEPMNIQQL